jgi:RNA polymerase sigma factor (sigma-70 family)
MTGPQPPPPGPPPRGVATAAPGRNAPAPEVLIDAVYRYAHRILRSCSHAPVPDAEDVTQQAFAALYAAKAAGRAPEDDGAYLLGVARRRVGDLLRRRATRRVPVALPAAWPSYAKEPLPDDVLAQAELRELVQVTLGLLPEPVRGLLEARYREGLGLAALAERLGTTEKGVENRLRRARAAFADLFGDAGGDWAGEVRP